MCRRGHGGDDFMAWTGLSVDTLGPLGTTLVTRVVNNEYKDARNKSFGKITVLGVSAKPNVVLVNWFTPIKSFSCDAVTQRLEIDLSKTNTKVARRITVLWR